MSLIVTEIPNADSEITYLYSHKYKRVFQVKSTDGSKFGPIAARAEVGIFPGTSYVNYWGETDAFAICTNVKTSLKAESGDVWEVTLEYDSVNPNLVFGNPLEIFPVATWSTVAFSRPIDFDTDGNLITNTAYDVFDPTIEFEDFRPILIIKRNEAVPPTAKIFNYKNTVNLDQFFIGSPGQVLCADIRGKPVWNGTIGLYYEVEYEFHFSRYDWGWKKRVLSAGYRELGTDSGGAIIQKPILINGINKAESPVPLDIDGHAIDINDPNWQQNIVWIEAEIFPKLFFANAFNFGGNIIGL